MTTNNPVTPSPRGGALRALGFALVISATGFFASQALAHGGGFMMGGDPERSAARIERMAKHLAVEADATPAQQEQLAAIAKAAAADLAPMRETLREHRQKTMALLAAPTIDRAQIEALRNEQVQNVDALSRRVAQALADAAEVLTPEQRQKLAQHIAERRGMGGHGRHRGGWGPWSRSDDGGESRSGG